MQTCDIAVIHLQSLLTEKQKQLTTIEQQREEQVSGVMAQISELDSKIATAKTSSNKILTTYGALPDTDASANLMISMLTSLFQVGENADTLSSLFIHFKHKIDQLTHEVKLSLQQLDKGWRQTPTENFDKIAVGNWIETIGYPKYRQIFIDNGVTWDLLKKYGTDLLPDLEIDDKMFARKLKVYLPLYGKPTVYSEQAPITIEQAVNRIGNELFIVQQFWTAMHENGVPIYENENITA